MIRIATLTIAVSLVALGLGRCQSDPKTGSERVDMRAETREESKATLASLYAIRPRAKLFVDSAAGYATFKTFGMKILVAGGGTGKGVAVDRATSKTIYMRMAAVSAGLGVNVSESRLVWVFDTQAAFDNFVENGWELGGSATAAAMVNNQGIAGEGALSIAPGVWLFQMTDTGLALELSVKGTKYYKDDGLN